MKSTLILNADAMPKSLIPLSVETWQDAITGIHTGKLTPLHNYEDWVVHSPSMSMPVPSVCILNKQVKIKHRFSSENDGPQNALIFLRDGYECQYCPGVFSRKNLTVDHVIPRSQGGKRKWNNLSTACEKCNFDRGTNTKIQPRNKPVRPTYDHLVKMTKRFPITLAHPSWNYYIGHPEHLVRIVSPQNYSVDDEYAIIDK
jgi:5-methylcytosine-specific restriction endonuclease McrA